jgi:hypothetical protein
VSARCNVERAHSISYIGVRQRGNMETDRSQDTNRNWHTHTQTHTETQTQTQTHTQTDTHTRPTNLSLGALSCGRACRRHGLCPTHSRRLARRACWAGWGRALLVTIRRLGGRLAGSRRVGCVRRCWPGLARWCWLGGRRRGRLGGGGPSCRRGCRSTRARLGEARRACGLRARVCV